MSFRNRLWSALPFTIVALIVGGIIGWLLPNPLTPQVIQSYRGALLRQDDSGYRLIAPLLACDIGSEQAFPEFVPLKQMLGTLIAQKIQSGEADHISLYLRSLKGARWIEINNTDTYAPASLLKVFVMMAYYKEADDADNPSLLNRPMVFEASKNPSANTPGEIIPHLTAGGVYSVNELVNQMIIYSDNDALNTLVDHFDAPTLRQFQSIFTDLNIPSPVTQNENSLNFMTVDNYAMVFRVLFGSTYLSNRYSEEALDLLSRAQYEGGIVAGVPASFDVAHKFGVTTVPATPTAPALNELHDCGIVYYPNHPYLLCIMTEGKSFATLQESIKDISANAYRWLDIYYKSLPSSTASTTPATVKP